MKEQASYDYILQGWLTGVAGRETRILQLREELLLLCSERGEAYARFIGVDRDQSVAAVKAELAGLTGGVE